MSQFRRLAYIERGRLWDRELVDNDTGREFERWSAVEASGDALESIRRMLHNARVLNHERFPKIETSDDSPTPKYFLVNAVESVRGEFLLKGGKIPPEFIARIMRDVCLAVSFGHDRGLVFQDLALKDVAVDIDGRVTVCHFGVQNEGAGRARYVAKETPKDVRSDVFSLGVILLELMAGMTGEVSDLIGASFADPNAFTPIREVSTRATFETREQRFETAREMAHALDFVIEQLPPVSDKQLGEWAANRSPTTAMSGAPLMASMIPNAAPTVERDSAPPMILDHPDARTERLDPGVITGELPAPKLPAKEPTPNPEILTLSGFNKFVTREEMPAVAGPEVEAQPIPDEKTKATPPIDSPEFALQQTTGVPAIADPFEAADTGVAGDPTLDDDPLGTAPTAALDIETVMAAQADPTIGAPAPTTNEPHDPGFMTLPNQWGSDVTGEPKLTGMAKFTASMNDALADIREGVTQFTQQAGQSVAIEKIVALIVVIFLAFAIAGFFVGC